MECSFVTERHFKRNLNSALSICTEHPSTKLNSQSAIILIQFLYQIDVVNIVWIITFDEPSRDSQFTFYLLNTDLSLTM